MSINQAAIHYNLPYSSLYGRFKRGRYDNSGNDSSHTEHSPDNTVRVRLFKVFSRIKEGRGKD